MQAALDETTVQIARGAAALCALALGLWLERVAPHARLSPAWRANLGLWAASTVLAIAVCGSCGFLAASFAAERGLGLLNAFPAPAALAIGATILTLDGVSWAWHRANHRLAFLWRFHRVHHADVAFHVSTALRFHPGEVLLSLPLRLAAIVALGAPLGAVLAFELAFGVANVLEHGNFDLPRRAERALAFVFVTPALHRRHHSCEPRELDCNFGTIFSFWDRLDRSFLSSGSAERFETGLRGATLAEATSLRAMLLAPLRGRAQPGA